MLFCKSSIVLATVLVLLGSEGKACNWIDGRFRNQSIPGDKHLSSLLKAGSPEGKKVVRIEVPKDGGAPKVFELAASVRAAYVSGEVQLVFLDLHGNVLVNANAYGEWTCRGDRLEYLHSREGAGESASYRTRFEKTLRLNAKGNLVYEYAVTHEGLFDQPRDTGRFVTEFERLRARPSPP